VKECLYTQDGAADTYRMYLPETNSIHETRDVQWGKRMYFEPSKGNLVHAIDSVELITIEHVVPLQTTALPITNQNQQMNNQGLHQGLVKGQVQFSE
jgi:hypothetical protein